MGYVPVLEETEKNEKEDAQKTFELRVATNFVEMRPVEKKIVVEVPNQYEPDGLKKVQITIIYDRDTLEGSAIKIAGATKLIQSDLNFIAKNYSDILRY